MKPIKLKMTAFGSYAEEAIVDFSEFDHGLYLITGDTGAGKTTIFDGIMFALYGQASGNSEASGKGEKAQVGDFRTFEMMHSDYADPGKPMSVVFEFEQSGKRYTVSRSCRFRKTRDGKEGTAEIKAVLSGDGMDAIENPSKVTEKISALLNMNADQFRKIIMLAQGEFSKFLGSGSDVKQKILGDLFGDSEYRYYQQLLSGARDKVRNQRVEYERQIRQALNGMKYSEGTDDEEKILYLPGHSELLKNLKELNEKDSIREAELKKAKEEALAFKTGLSEEKGTAELHNQDLDELKKKEELADSLKAEELDMQRLQKNARDFEHAFHFIKPAEEKKTGAENRLKEAAESEKRYQEALLQAETDVKKSEQDTVRNGEKQQRINELIGQIQTIQDAEKSYGDLKTAERNKEKARKRIEEKEKEKEGLTSEEKKLASSQREMEEELSGLQDVNAEAEKVKNDCQKAGEQLEKLIGEKGIRSRLSEIKKAETEYRDLQKELIEKTEAASAAIDNYKKLYDDFLQGQAGYLSSDTQNKLKEKGEAVCPVCGTMLIRGKSYHFAERLTGTPDRGTVNAAFQEHKRANNALNAISAQVSEKKSKISEKKKNVLADFEKMEPACSSWERLTAAGYFERVVGKYDAIEKEARNRLNEIQKKQTRYSLLMENRRELEKKIGENTEALKKADSEIASCKEEFSRYEEKEFVLKGKLPYPSWEEAEKKKNSFEGMRARLEKEIQESEKTLKEAREKYRETSGNLNQIRENLPDLEASLRTEEEKLTETLTVYGFPDLKSVHEVLLLCGRQEGQSWLNKQKKIISDYENACENTKQRILDLTEKTKSYHYTDMEELKRRLDEAEQKYTEADDAVASFSILAQNHADIYQKVREAREALAGTERTWQVVSSLGDLAAGVSSADGKWDFDSYVMGAMFEEVLVMANQRLSIMSDGQYELEHEAVGKIRKNSVAGMEISVKDMMTGKSRKSSSLSGGEKFLTSLSLALGLSDVVQAHAGGTTLEALFIDEGFGTLDDTILDKALSVLNQLANGSRQVGIISHVSRLEESISQKIIVKKGERGSWIRIQK